MATTKKQGPTVTETLLKKLGEDFLAERTAKGWSLQDLQAKSGVSYITISPIERGKAKNAVLSKLQAIAQALGKDLNLSLTQASAKK